MSSVFGKGAVEIQTRSKRRLLRPGVIELASRGQPRLIGDFSRVCRRGDAGLRRITVAENTIKLCPAYPEQFRGTYFVSANALQYTERMTFFHLFECGKSFFVLNLARLSVSDVFREVADVDGFAFRHHAGASKHVFQLSHIAWPRMSSQ